MLYVIVVISIAHYRAAALDMPNWRKFTFKLATFFEVMAETVTGTYRVLEIEMMPGRWTNGNLSMPPDVRRSPVPHVLSAGVVTVTVPLHCNMRSLISTVA